MMPLPHYPSNATSRDVIEYIDLLYQLMDIDMTYNKFKNLSESEKIQFIRDVKIKKIIENNVIS